MSGKERKFFEGKERKSYNLKMNPIDSGLDKKKKD